MNKLNDREQSLVALGAALAANCIPCIEYHIPEAQKAGLDAAEIKEAVQIAHKVRRVPARMVMQSALARIDASPADPHETAGAGCCRAESDSSDCTS